MRRVKGSLTVEASLILPMMIIMFAIAMNTGIKMYQECIEGAAAIAEEEKFEIVKTFQNWDRLGDIGKNED